MKPSAVERFLGGGAAGVLVAAVLVVLTPGSTCPAFAQATFGRADPNGGEGVPRINVQLTDRHLQPLRTLTHDDTSNEAAISPDGQQLAYASGRGFPNDTEVGRTGSRIRLVDIDGRRNHVVSDGYDVEPAWSPNGSELVFIRASQPAALWKVELSTGRQTEIVGAHGLETNVRPQWLTTGRILFTTQSGVESIRPTGGTPTLIAPNTGRITFSADGSRYALAPTGWHGTIDVVTTATGQKERVPRSATAVATPLLWTDEGRLVFTQNVAGADVNVVSWRPGDRRPTLIRRGAVPIDLADNPACGP